MDDAMHEKPLIPGFEKPHHLKVAAFVTTLWEALGPLGKAEQDRVLHALVPLWKQVGASDVPSSAEGFHRKFGLDIEIKRKLKRIDYCDCKKCGFMQLIPLDERPQATCALCEHCFATIYDVSVHRGKMKLAPRSCDFVIDPYEAVKDFLNRPEFWEYYEELWPAVEECYKNADGAQTKYRDWLNGQARRFFRYVREKHGPNFLRYDKENNGEIFIFLMDIGDYMSSATNIKQNRGAKSFGGHVRKTLSLPARVRNLGNWTFPDQVYNDGKKVKNPLQRQEWRLRSALEWVEGRPILLNDGRTIKVHIVHMWTQGDGPMLEELAGRTNFMNPAWWWQHHLESIKAHALNSKSKSKSHVVYPALINRNAQKRTPEEIDQLARNVANVRKAGGTAKDVEQAVQANGAHWESAYGGGLLEERGLPGLGYYQFDHFWMQGWDHIHAGVIKDIMKLCAFGMPAAAKDVIRETIAHTQTARGEPTLCNWLDDGHNKIHSCLQWFGHDAMYHLWRVLPEDQLVMVTMLWLHFIHVREAEPTEEDLEISSKAREIYQIQKELRFGMTTSKPNDVKLRRIEHSVREFMVLPASSELVVDTAMKGIMLSLRKLLTNGNDMQGAMKQVVLRQLMVQVRWFSGAPIAHHGRSPRPELLRVPSSNENLQLLGVTQTTFAAAALCLDQLALLQAAIEAFGFNPNASKQIAEHAMVTLLPCWQRMRTTYSHPGRSFCTTRHDQASSHRVHGRCLKTPSKQGRYLLLHPAHGEPVLMMVSDIFGIPSADGLRLFCFASGLRFETREPRQEATSRFASGVVKCATWPPAARTVMPLLPTTRLEAVSIVPFFFLEGNPATAVRSATEVLYIPRETLPAMEEDLLTNLVALRAGLEPLAIAEVQKQAEKTAARALEGTGSTGALNPARLKKAELEQELRKRHVPVDFEENGKRKAYKVPDMRKFLRAAIERDAAAATVTRAMAEIAGMEQGDGAGAAQPQPQA